MERIRKMQIVLSTFDLRLSNTSELVQERLGIDYGTESYSDSYDIKGGKRNFKSIRSLYQDEWYGECSNIFW